MNRTPARRRLRTLFAVTLLISVLSLSLAALRPTSVAAQATPTCYSAVSLELLPGDGAQFEYFTRAGHVLGSARATDGQYHRFIYNGTGMHDLDAALGDPARRFEVFEAHRAIAADGSVFGVARDDSAGTQSAVVFDDQGIHTVSLGGPFGVAIEMNEAGQATGAATIDADNQILHAFRYDHGNVVDLGTIGGSRSYPYAISENGKVVGESSNADGEQHAFLYDDAGIHDLGTLPGGNLSIAYAVNNAGQVAGFSSLADGSQHAFLYDGTTMQDLGVLPDGVGTNATHINAQGHVVGRAYMANNQQHIFLYDGTTMHDLTPDAERAEVLYVTDSGVVVGKAYTTQNTAHGHVFVYDAAGLHTLSLGGSVSDAGYNFGNLNTNDSGQVVGASYLPGDSIQHAFLYDADGLHDLTPQPGDYSDAAAINSAGDVVGSNNQSAFVYSGGVMKNLNAFTCNGGLMLGAAYGISDDGKILAADTNQGFLYLLTPSFDQPTTAEVSVGAAVDRSIVPPGEQFTYTIYVTNLGPLAASDVTLTSQLPAGVTLDAIVDQGSGACSLAPGGAGLTCTFASINPLSSNTVRVTATSNVAGAPYTPVTTSFTVASTTPDDVPGNNTGTIDYRIGIPAVPAPTPGPANDAELAYYEYLSDSSQYDIFRRRADGAGLLNLTDSPDLELDFSWSPDGNKIAFSRFSYSTNSSDVYIMNADGTNVLRLTDTPDEHDGSVAWSPDGSKLAFVSLTPASFANRLRVINADGTGLVTITPTDSLDTSHSWSPDGTRLTFVRNTLDGNGDSVANIYVAQADGSSQFKLEHAANAQDSVPAWSPDGTRIAFVRYLTDDDPSFQGDVYTVRPDGTDLHALTTDHVVNNTSLQWSPDASKLSFIGTRSEMYSLDVINADGTHLVTIINHNEFSPGAERWSPDGTRIAYQTCSGECERAGIYVVNADGTGRFQLGDDREHNYGPVWSPDGARIAFTSNRNGVSSIDLINADGTGRVDLTNRAGYYGLPQWRPRPQQQNTPAGSNVTVAASGAAVTFSNVTQAGQTAVTPIDPNTLSGVPGEYVINANTLAFEITTTAVYTGPITIGFQVPGVNNPVTFSALRVLHGEPPPVPNFVDRTILAPDSPSHDFPSRTVYARVTSLSPFLIAERVPTDATPPAVQLNQPAEAVYLLRQNVVADYSCTDAGGSGLAQCAGPVASGSRINTSAVGSFSFTVNARDNAGNTTTRTVNYRVAYGVNPLFDQTKTNKSGSTIPVKLELADAAGANQSAVGVAVTAVSIVRVSDDSSGVLQTPGESNPDYNFRYQSGGYHFNLKTTGYASGTYRLNFRAGSDEVVHSVQFKVK